MVWIQSQKRKGWIFWKMELSSTLDKPCGPAHKYSSCNTYLHFCCLHLPLPIFSSVASPAPVPSNPSCRLPVPVPESAPYTTASDFVLSWGTWGSLRSLRTCSILWSLHTCQAIKGKVTRWTEAHSKAILGSFNFSQYFGMKGCFPDTLHPIFVGYPSFIFMFAFSALRYHFSL